MRIKYPYIALDLDGTLLNAKKQVSLPDYHAIRLYTSLGGKVILASGRSPLATEWIAENLGVEKSLVAFNGSFIQTGQVNTCLYVESAFTPAELSELIALAVRLNLEYIIYEKNAMRINKVTPLNTRWLDELLCFDYLGTRVSYESFRSRCRLLVGGAAEAKEGVLKFVLLPSWEGGLDTAFELLSGSSFSLNKTPRYIEITKQQYDKAYGISKILEDTAYTICDIMAVGDNYNDVSMLKAAKLGVAVENSPCEIKALADAVTSSNNDHGVAEAILKYAVDYCN